MRRSRADARRACVHLHPTCDLRLRAAANDTRSISPATRHRLCNHRTSTSTVSSRPDTVSLMSSHRNAYPHKHLHLSSRISRRYVRRRPFALRSRANSALWSWPPARIHVHILWAEVPPYPSRDRIESVLLCLGTQILRVLCDSRELQILLEVLLEVVIVADIEVGARFHGCALRDHSRRRDDRDFLDGIFLASGRHLDGDRGDG